MIPCLWSPEHVSAQLHMAVKLSQTQLHTHEPWKCIVVALHMV